MIFNYSPSYPRRWLIDERKGAMVGISDQRCREDAINAINRYTIIRKIANLYNIVRHHNRRTIVSRSRLKSERNQFSTELCDPSRSSLVESPLRSHRERWKLCFYSFYWFSINSCCKFDDISMIDEVHCEIRQRNSMLMKAEKILNNLKIESCDFGAKYILCTRTC